MVRSISGILSDIVSDCCINSFSPELPLLDDTAKFILTAKFEFVIISHLVVKKESQKSSVLKEFI